MGIPDVDVSTIFFIQIRFLRPTNHSVTWSLFAYRETALGLLGFGHLRR